MEKSLTERDVTLDGEPFRISKIIFPLVAIISGIFMTILDSTAMNVAITTLVRDFDSQLSTLQWTVTGYMLAQAAVIPLAGWLSDRYGAKRIFMLSIFLFTLGSALCATPNSAEWLIAFRVIQGLGGGFVFPIAMAYVYRLSPRNRVGMVMGMMGIPVLFAPAIGPVLSGWLVEYHSWRWIFLINIPVGMISLALAWFKLPKVDKNSTSQLDLLGIIFGPLAFAALSFGISQGAESWTSAKALIGLIGGGIALIIFVIVELRARVPLLELRVFGSPDFSIGIVAQWVIQFSLFGAIFLLPQFLQQAKGFEAFDTGLTLFPQAIASAFFMPIGGYLFDKIGVRWLVVAGLSLVSGAIYQYSLIDINTTRMDLLLPLVMAGAGMGLMMMPMNSHLINMSPRKLVSRVTSLTTAMQQIVNSFAVAIVVTILTTKSAAKMQDLQVAAIAQGQQVDPDQPTASMLAAMMDAAVKSFDETFAVMLFVSIGGIALGLLLRRRTKEAVTTTPDDSTEEKSAEASFMHG